MTTLQSFRLRGYLLGVSAFGLPLLALACLRIKPADIANHWLLLAAGAIVLIIGELRPIPVSRGANAGDELSISSTMAVALLWLASPGVACAGQATALLVDELRGRRAWDRFAFNVGQYTLALIGTRAMFALLTHSSVFGQPSTLTARQLPAAIGSTAVFFLINNGLTGIAVAIATRMPVRRLIWADLKFHLPTGGVMLALAPVVAHAMSWTVFALPLLLVPLVAVHQSARLAAAREHEARHDALTGMPNRTSFRLRLQQACEDVDVAPFAVMLLDLDHFKDINDTLGHHVGDLLLVEVADRLQGALRDGDVVARLGGDEFAVLAHHTSGESAALEVADRIKTAFASTFPLSGADLTAQCSIGVALAPRDGRDEDVLLKRADVALYDAKNTRGSVATYDDTRDEHSVERLALVADLRSGMECGDVFPLYQPQCDAKTGKIVGVEALARWRHPHYGVLPPGRFIDVAEGAGLLDELTYLLLDQALAQLADWHAQGHEFSLAVNVSPRTMRDERVIDRVAAALERSGVEPRWLTLEVTEHVLVSDAERSLRVLAGLRRLGCRLAIDDFGTGYSSMAYLKRLPVHELKIDRSFVAALGEDPHDEIIVRATVDLAHRFGLSVTAEGVETEIAWSLLAAMDCDDVQGYYLSHPLTVEALGAWLANRTGETRAVTRPTLQVV